MKINKKMIKHRILLTLGMVATVAPLATALACGSEQTTTQQQKSPEPQANTPHTTNPQDPAMIGNNLQQTISQQRNEQTIVLAAKNMFSDESLKTQVLRQPFNIPLQVGSVELRTINALSGIRQLPDASSTGATVTYVASAPDVVHLSQTLEVTITSGHTVDRTIHITLIYAPVIALTDAGKLAAAVRLFSDHSMLFQDATENVDNHLKPGTTVSAADIDGLGIPNHMPDVALTGTSVTYHAGAVSGLTQTFTAALTAGSEHVNFTITITYLPVPPSHDQLNVDAAVHLFTPQIATQHTRQTVDLHLIPGATVTQADINALGIINHMPDIASTGASVAYHVGAITDLTQVITADISSGLVHAPVTIRITYGASVRYDAAQIQAAAEMFEPAIRTQRVYMRYEDALPALLTDKAAINNTLVNKLPIALPAGVRVAYKVIAAADPVTFSQEITATISLRSAPVNVVHINITYAGISPADFRRLYPNKLSADGSTIVADAFAHWQNLPADFVLPRGITTIEHGAFSHAILPAGFSLPSTVSTINDDAFNGVALSDFFQIPSGVRTIGAGAFANAHLPRGIKIPPSATFVAVDTDEGPVASFSHAVLPVGYEWQNEDAQKIEDQSQPFAGCFVASIPDAEKITTTAEEFTAQIKLQLVTTHIYDALKEGETDKDAINGVLIRKLPTNILPGVNITYAVAAADLALLTQDITVTISAGSAVSAVLHIQITYQGKDLGNYLEHYRTTISSDGTTIAPIAFVNSNLNANFDLPATVTTISDNAFAGATLTSYFRIPPLVETLGSGVFNGAHLSAGFTIPAKITIVETGDGKEIIPTFFDVHLPVGYEWQDAHGNKLVDQTHPVPGSVVGPMSAADKITRTSTTLFTDRILRQSQIVAHIYDALRVDESDQATINRVLGEKLPVSFLPGVTITYRAEAPHWDVLTQNIVVTISAADARPLRLNILVPYEGITLVQFLLLYPTKISADGTTINNGAFAGVTLPPDFELPATVTTIDDRAFAGATLPVGFKLPPLVNLIGYGSFKTAHLPIGFAIPSGVSIKTDDAIAGHESSFLDVHLPANSRWRNSAGNPIADQSKPLPGSVVAV